MSDRGEMRSARTVQAKNRAPAPIQITAEQILLEARDRAQQAQPPPPKRHITDIAELKDHQLRVRKEFEDRLRLSRTNLSVWMRYAKWEEGQNEVERARSIYERALDIDFKHVPLWIRYAEMEMKHKFINRARNVWDRAVTLLPRVETLWYKYTYMEEVLGNIVGARTVFERWMTWEPDEQAWLSYAKLEIRASELDRARAIYERYLACHPSQTAYLRYARWEERNNGQKALARRLYERATVELREEEKDEKLYESFALFEERCGETERARIVFKYGLESLAPPGVEAGEQAAAAVAALALQGENTPAGKKAAAYGRLCDAYTRFEKSRGEKNAVEEVVVDKRRAEYEAQVRSNPLNYDAWLDYTRLEEVEGADIAYSKALHALRGSSASQTGPHASDPLGHHAAVVAQAQRIREVYERAVACVPPVQDKKYWRRYIFLWLNYAAWEELLCPAGAREGGGAQDDTSTPSTTGGSQHGCARAAAVYKAALSVIPHAKFTFAKLWLSAAKCEVRRGDVGSARKLLGQALGQCFKPRLVRGYIQLEASLGELDRCRKLYEVWLTRQPASSTAWCAFAGLEHSVGEAERARSVLELAIAQPALDAPEVAWKAAIDLELAAGDTLRARGLYERLLERTQHVKVWLSFAAFEYTAGAEGGEGQAQAREVFQRGYDALKALGGKSAEEGDAGVRAQRALLAETWLEWERSRWDEAQDRLVGLEVAAGLRLPPSAGSGADGAGTGGVAVAAIAKDDAEIDLDDADGDGDADMRAGGTGEGEGTDGAQASSGVDVDMEGPRAPQAAAVDPAVLSAAREAVASAQARVDKVQALQPQRLRRRRPVYEDGTRGAALGSAEAGGAAAPATSPVTGAALTGYEDYSEWAFPDDATQAPALKLLQLAQAWKAGKLSMATMFAGASTAAAATGGSAGAAGNGSGDGEEAAASSASAPFGGLLGGARAGAAGAGTGGGLASVGVRGLLASALQDTRAVLRAGALDGDAQDEEEAEAEAPVGGGTGRHKRARGGVGEEPEEGGDALAAAVAEHIQRVPQSTYAEGEAQDGMEEERGLEDEVRGVGWAAGATGSARVVAAAPDHHARRVTDLHAEGDPGWSADRDV